MGALTERLEHDLVLSMLPPLEGTRVLDVGCGDGELTQKLAELGADVIGVDVNPDMVAVAQRRRSGTYKVADATALPFDDETFDVVIAVTVLCVCDDPKILVGEMARVLKPGGRSVIGELGKFSLWALSRRLRGLAGNRMWQETRFFTMAELAALVAGADMDIQATRGAVYYPPLNVAARLMAPMDSVLSQVSGQLGASFVAVCSEKTT